MRAKLDGDGGIIGCRMGEGKAESNSAWAISEGEKATHDPNFEIRMDHSQKAPEREGRAKAELTAPTATPAKQ